MYTILNVPHTSLHTRNRQCVNPGCYSIGSLVRPWRTSGMGIKVPKLPHPASDRAGRTRTLVTSRPVPSQMVESPSTFNFRATIRSSAPWHDDSGKYLSFGLVDRDTGVESRLIKLDNAKALNRATPELGWSISIPVTDVEDVRYPGAIVLYNTRDNSTAEQDTLSDYILEVTLETDHQTLVFPVSSWVAPEHGRRYFFSPDSYIPSDTPPGLLEIRDQELKVFRGETVDSSVLKAPRTASDRIYDYQVYNDLGKPYAFRDTLGGNGIYPYPRRIATNRPLDPRGQEVAPEGGEPWLPYDEKFEFGKASGFNAASIYAAIPIIARLLSVQTAQELRRAARHRLLTRILDFLPFLKSFITLPPLVDNFEDMRDVLNLYAMGPGGVKVKDLLPTELYPSKNAGGAAASPTMAAILAEESSFLKRFKTQDGAWDFSLGDDEAEDAERQIATNAAAAMTKSPEGVAPASEAAPRALGTAAATRRKFNLAGYLADMVRQGGGVRKQLEFPVPRSLQDRPNEWYQDREVGRQAVAGMNPCTLEALTLKSWAALKAVGSSLTEEKALPSIEGQLQGQSIAELLQRAASGAKPRLFFIDYWALSHFWKDATAENKVQHAGRALFYLKKKQGSEEDEALVPIAIELAHAGTVRQNPGLSASQGLVYTPKDFDSDEGVIWRLAKAIFRSLDTSYHQLVSHWLRTHACLEPFYIAMQRNVSQMHPVMRLMLPHFRYTLNINANARSSLVNAGGIIEQNFSAGEYAMRLSAVVYKLKWRFATQNLPADLKKRGMVDANGKPWMEYPYAEDGLDLHNALTQYFTQYLDLYYSTDAQVAEDQELQAWWSEVKSKGHPDWHFSGASEEEMWGFKGGIPSKAQLILVLVTIAWTASAHHAAVNFGQYDFSGLPLNFSSLVQKPMPAPGDAEYQKLVELSRSRKYTEQERLYLSYLADVKAAVLVMVTIRLLSTHADDEQTLVMRNKYLQDPKAVALNDDFIRDMVALEKSFEARNNNTASWARAATSPESSSMAYNLLLPSSGPGMTGRGVPYSVSI